MAFTTIAWDGVGVIANCDALADSAGGTWAELGGGGISANPDTYLTPPASIGHVYASKSGFGYYTAPATYDFTPTTGAQEGQFIYIWIQIASASAFDTLANNGFSFVVGTDTSNYRTFKLAGSGAGEGKPFDGGGWKLFAFDPTITGSIADVGTFNLATINMVGLWMDTIVSVRADTIFIDQVAIGKGLRVTGTGTLDEAVTYCTDYASRAWGVFQKRGTIYFAYGGLSIGDTVAASVNTNFTDSGNVMEFGFTEFWDGTTWSLTHPSTYNKVNVEKHASFTTDYTSSNTSLLGSSGSELSINVDTGSTIDLSGGQLREMLQLTQATGEVLVNKVMSGILATSLANIPVGCTWDTCGQITLGSGGGLESCAIINGTSIIDVSSDIANVPNIANTSFTSSGTGNGLEITGVADNITLDNIDFTDYSLTLDADKAIFVNIATGTVTLNISAGSGVTDLTHVRTAGATIIVSADVSVTFTGLLDDTEVRIYKTSDDTSIGGTESATAGTTDDRTFTFSAPAATAYYYKILKLGYEMIDILNQDVPSTNASISIQQRVDRNEYNPA